MAEEIENPQNTEEPKEEKKATSPPKETSDKGDTTTSDKGEKGKTKKESKKSGTTGTENTGSTSPTSDEEKPKESILDSIKSTAKDADWSGLAQKGIGLLSKDEDKTPSLAEQMKEMNEVQVDKAFVDDSLKLLNGLSFDQLIGNPLRAAVKAQRDMAKETLNFIKDEAIRIDKNGQGQLTYVSLSFIRDGKAVKMQVPLITLIPIPTLAISEMTYTFKAKVNAGSSVVVSVGSGNSPIGTQAGFGPIPSTTNNGKETNKAEGNSSADKKSGDDTIKAADKSANTPSTSIAAATSKATPKTDASMSASYSTKKDSGATRDSRYSVETTMDIGITAKQAELPKGIERLINTLDQSTEVIDSNGELQLSAEQLSLTNGHAVLSASYRNKEGIYSPTTIKCTPLDMEKPTESSNKDIIALPSGDDVLFVFNSKGTYLVAADKLCRIVFVS